MTYTTSQAPGYLRAMLPLPQDAWERIGSHLSKGERQQVLRAWEVLKKREPDVTGYPDLWRTDQLYNALLPRSLQERGIISSPTAPLTAAVREALHQRQQAWLACHARLRQWVSALPPKISQIPWDTMAARVRCTPRHDIETMVALPDRDEVVLVGRRKNARSERKSPNREAYVYSLAEPTSPWQGRLMSIPLEWAKPTRLVPAGQGGVFASFVKAVDMDDVVTTHLWQSDGQSFEMIEWYAGASFEDSTVCFRPDASLFQCVVHGRKLCEVGTRGLYWFSLQKFINQDSHLNLHTDAFTPLADCNVKFVNVVLSASGRSALLVSQRGDIIVSPMDRKRAPSFVRAQTLDFEGGFKDAVTSPGTNVIVMRDASDRLLAWKKQGPSGQIIWRMPKRRTPSTASKRPITDYRLSPNGQRVGVLRDGALLEIWSLAADKAVSRFSFLGEAPIVHFDFSPYSHALLAATPHRTFVVLPTTPKPLKIPVPHVGATGRFMPGMLRLVGHVNSTLWDIDLGAEPERRQEEQEDLPAPVPQS